MRDVGALARACVHCGLCLPHCPTYRALREEADSPRGRILLLDALEDGRLAAADVAPHLDRCVGCLACESVCPSGVPFGALLEEGRTRLGGPGPRARFFLRHLLPRPWALRALVAAGRLLGRLPPAPPKIPLPAPGDGARGRVALHLGCVTPLLFPNLAAEAAFVLGRLGFAVDVPEGQGCCGALHRHAGLDDAEFASRQRTAFTDATPIVSCAAGCSATPGLTDVCDLLLGARPFRGARLPPVRAAYDAPCHLIHRDRAIDAAPLLDAIEGVDRVPLDGAERCCGAGGLYMELQPRLARAVREEKLDAIARSGAAVVVTPNPGCMVWLWRGLRERRLPVEVVHPVTLLARALGAGRR